MILNEVMIIVSVVFVCVICYSLGYIEGKHKTKMTAIDLAKTIEELNFVSKLLAHGNPRTSKNKNFTNVKAV